MYKVELYEYGQKPITVLDFNNRIQFLSSCTLDKQEDNIDSLSMTINHEFLMQQGIKIKPSKTLCKVTNTKKNKVEFIGRVLSPEESMTDSGSFTHNYVFEGALSFLMDTIQKYSFEFDKMPIDNLKLLLDMHNTEMSASGENYKRVYVRNCDVPKNEIPNDGGYHEEEMYFKRWEDKDTLSTINEDLIGKYGGHIIINEYTSDALYIDYVKETGVKKTTDILLGKNLKSIQRKIDPSEVITRVKPLGSSSETANGDEIRLTIADVNNGSPYIDIPELIAIYGVQTGIVDLPEKYTPITLKEEALKWIEEQKKKVAKVSISLDALDLSLIGLDPDDFDIFNIHHTKCPMLNIDDDLKIIGISIDLMNPQNKSITIGEKLLTLQEVQQQENIKVTNNIINNEVPSIIKEEVPVIIDNAIQQQVPDIVNKATADFLVTDVKKAIKDSLVGVATLSDVDGKVNIAVNNFQRLTFDPYKLTVDNLIDSKITNFKNNSLSTIINTAVDAKQSTINQAVIDKINSSSNVLRADALSVDSALINKISAQQIATNALTSSEVFASQIAASQAIIDRIKVTNIDLNRATVSGSVDSKNYLVITSDYIKQNGSYNSVDLDGYSTPVAGFTRFKNGMIQIRNDTQNRSLYLHDRGFSTFSPDTNTLLDSSGSIAFFDTTFGSPGLYISSNNGGIGINAFNNTLMLSGKTTRLTAASSLNLDCDNASLYIKPFTRTRVGTNEFNFWVKDNSNQALTDGVIRYGDFSTTWGSGIRFDKSSTETYIYATNNNGDIGTGDFHAKSFVNASYVEYKQNIEKWDYDALNVIMNELDLYSYKYKADTTKLHRGVVIGDGYKTPPEFITGDGVNMYEMTTWALRAIQQLGNKNIELENKIEELKGA